MTKQLTANIDGPVRAAPLKDGGWGIVDLYGVELLKVTGVVECREQEFAMKVAEMLNRR